MGVMIIMTSLLMLNLAQPYLLSDPDNFINANPMVTQVHIQPEWYFLFAYAISRSIPNKLGGVMALFMSILILMVLPISMKMKFNSISSFYPLSQYMYWTFIVLVMLLTWVGARPVELPFTLTGVILTMMYFMYFLMYPIMVKMWDKNIN